MNIKISRDAICGKVYVSAGDYFVALDSGSQCILLSAGGKTLKLPAKRRRTASKTKTETVILVPGGAIWALTINSPRGGEWVSFLDTKAASAGKPEN